MRLRKPSVGIQTTAEPCICVVFGGTGDLMHRKLLPALAHLAQDQRLPKKYVILAVGRDATLTDARFRNWAKKALKEAAIKLGSKHARWCDTCLYYQSMKASTASDFQALGKRVAELERKHGLPSNRIFYLALPPNAFAGTIVGLGAADLNRSKGWTHLVIEKPFGTDLPSAQKLNTVVHKYFDESQVYRIDHYLGKETVQNLLAFRFGNALFESVWNRDHIESVCITVAEDIGVEERGRYYEQAGALRDMVQNHLTQLLTLIAMEVPNAFDADNIRFEKIKALRSITPIAKDAIVFGQYTAGRISGKNAVAYRTESDVAPKSTTPTFVALQLAIENWRWHGVPFYLRTGKRLAQHTTEIVIAFRAPPIALFQELDGCETHPNVLVITVQPDEGFDLSFEVKTPGEQFTLQTRHMKFSYAQAFGAPADGYETLLLDVMLGNQTLFVHAEETEASWSLYTPVLRHPPPLKMYRAGSWGPAAADKLIGRASGKKNNAEPCD